MCSISGINQLNPRLLINSTHLLWSINISPNNNQTTFDNRISFLTIIFKFMTIVIQQSLFNIGLIIYLFYLDVLVSSLLVDKVVELVHFYVAADGGVELGCCWCD